jgi:hypothetical protein
MALAPQDLSAHFSADVAFERDLSTYRLKDEDILVERRGRN